MLNAAGYKQHAGVWHTRNYAADICDLESLHAARLDALEKVDTEFCAYIDRDDDLPNNTQEQLPRLINAMRQQDAALGYTDYLQRTHEGETVVRPGVYVWAKHMTQTTLIHQLAVMRTKAAQKIAKRLPRGLYWTEFLLHAKLAQKPSVYFPEIGYVYNRKNVGMHAHKDIITAQKNSLQWHLRYDLPTV